MHPVYNVQDWDDAPGAIDWPRLRASLKHVKDHGVLPDSHYSHDHLNEQREVPVSRDILEQLKTQFREVESQWKAKGFEVTWALLDAFLLYWDKEVVDQLDVKTFIHVPEEVLRKRRHERHGYHTAVQSDGSEGSLWRDPPNYWEQIVYPAYSRAHKHLFKDEDVEKGDLALEMATIPQPPPPPPPPPPSAPPSSQSSGGSSLPLILGLLAIGGGGAYYLTQTGDGNDLKQEAKAEAKSVQAQANAKYEQARDAASAKAADLQRDAERAKDQAAAKTASLYDKSASKLAEAKDEAKGAYNSAWGRAEDAKRDASAKAGQLKSDAEKQAESAKQTWWEWIGWSSKKTDEAKREAAANVADAAGKVQKEASKRA
ncbi:unnamed protein product [Rhizoctonia solani]|uniref:Uncharacterized protein n=1 Tax=Rhizoctonia solani TaxID=456999 RepID=A0A8H2W9P0_9AGAM|nr:unnamed protein product [Rhizoctonia solani]